MPLNLVDDIGVFDKPRKRLVDDLGVFGEPEKSEGLVDDLGILDKKRKPLIDDLGILPQAPPAIEQKQPLDALSGTQAPQLSPQERRPFVPRLGELLTQAAISPQTAATNLYRDRIRPEIQPTMKLFTTHPKGALGLEKITPEQLEKTEMEWSEVLSDAFGEVDASKHYGLAVTNEFAKNYVGDWMGAMTTPETYFAWYGMQKAMPVVAKQVGKYFKSKSPKLYEAMIKQRDLPFVKSKQKLVDDSIDELRLLFQERLKVPPDKANAMAAKSIHAKMQTEGGMGKVSKDTLKQTLNTLRQVRESKFGIPPEYAPKTTGIEQPMAKPPEPPAPKPSVSKPTLKPVDIDAPKQAPLAGAEKRTSVSKVLGEEAKKFDKVEEFVDSLKKQKKIKYHGTPFGDFVTRAKRINLARKDAQKEVEQLDKRKGVLLAEIEKQRELEKSVKEELKSAIDPVMSKKRYLSYPKDASEKGWADIARLQKERSKIEKTRAGYYKEIEKIDAQRRKIDVPREEKEEHKFKYIQANDYGYMGAGYYFSESVEGATGWSKMSPRAGFRGEKREPYIYEAVLDIKKPFMLGESEWTEQMASDYESYLKREHTGRDIDAKQQAHAQAETYAYKKAGYDAVIGRPSQSEDIEYLVFDSGNIKTKQQLTETWEQSQEPTVKPKVETVKPTALEILQLSKDELRGKYPEHVGRLDKEEARINTERLKKVDVAKKDMDALAQKRKQLEETYVDWQSRVYKESGKKVTIQKDEYDPRVSRTYTEINEARRRNTLKGIESQIRDIDKKTEKILKDYPELKGKPTTPKATKPAVKGKVEAKVGDNVEFLTEGGMSKTGTVSSLFKGKYYVVPDGATNSIPVKSISKVIPTKYVGEKPRIKQQYDLTQEEFVNKMTGTGLDEKQRAEVHKIVVEEAIQEGKIKSHPDYPELTRKAKVEPPAQEQAPQEEPKRIRATVEEIEKIRDKYDLEFVNLDSARKWTGIFNRAEGRVKEAPFIVSSIMKKPRVLENEEFATLLIRRAELEEAIDTAEAAAAKAVDSGNETEQSRQSAIAIEALEELNSTTEALRWSNREAGRALNLVKLTIEKEATQYKLSKLLQKAKISKGKKLTEKEVKEFAALAERIKKAEAKEVELQKQIDILEEKLAKAEANSSFGDTTKSIKRKRTRNVLAKERNDLFKQLGEIGYRLNDITGVTYESAKIISSIAVNYFESGTTKIEDIAERITTKLPDLTKKDIYDSVGGRIKSTKKKVVSETRMGINDLKMQARLLGQIEDAYNNIFDQVKKRPQSTPKVKALQEKLKRLKTRANNTIREEKRLHDILQKIDKLSDSLTKGTGIAKAARKMDSQRIKEAKQDLSELRRLLSTNEKIKDLENQLKTGDYKVPVRIKRVIKRADLMDAQIKLSQLRREVREKIHNMRKRTKREVFVDIASLPRELMATADFSAAGRQAAILSSLDPIGTLKILKDSLPSFFSEDKASEIELRIKQHENHSIRLKAGLKIRSFENVKFSEREEYFLSTLGEKIPLYGHVVRGSNRHMVSHLNLIRVMAFDRFLKLYPNATDQELKDWANYVNICSGIGDLGAFNKVAGELSIVFFSPRFSASRIQLPYELLKYNKSPRVKKEIAKNYMKFTALVGLALWLAHLGGAGVELDPESSDWLKIKIGNTRIDPWGGLQQPTRLTVLIMLKGLQTAGMYKMKRNIDLYNSVSRFISYKMSPFVTAPVELWQGKDVIGRAMNPLQTITRHMTPLVAQEIIETYQSNKVLGAVLAPFILLGVGVSTYESKMKKSKSPFGKNAFGGSKSGSSGSSKSAFGKNVFKS